MFNFKELFGGVVLLVILGVAGFLYRSVMEQPPLGAGASCALERKTCPDGTTVGRVGPVCAFAPCPAPNVELPNADIAFVLPAGYAPIATSSWPDTQTHIVYEAGHTGSASTTSSVFMIRDYPLSVRESADELMRRVTVLVPSGRTPSLAQFATTTIGTNTFHTIEIARYGGRVQTAYYLPRAHDVLRFDVTERNVTDWNNDTFVVRDLPGHQALVALLKTLQTSS